MAAKGKSKKKGNRIQVILESREGNKTSRYISFKNRKNNPDRLKLMKYNPYLRKYTLHEEIK